LQAIPMSSGTPESCWWPPA